MEQHINRYTKYINEALQKIDIDTATYRDHLHKVFEWYGCIHLSQESGTIVLRWEDIPADLREEKCMSRDMGIDAFDIVGKCMIQMKLYHGTISWRALSTFLACHLSFADHKMILYRNTESQVCNLIAHHIKEKIMEDRTVTDVEFRKECKRIQKLKIKIVSSVEKKENRSYQQDAKQMIEQARERTCNLILCLPTGTGKTWVILDYHLEHRDEITLILVPTRVLLGQWNDTCKELGIQTYLVDSNHHRDLKKYNGETIVICVYDSYKNIHEEIDRWKRIVADEAHHIFKPERYMEIEDDYDDFSEEEMDEEFEEEEERPISSMLLIRDLHQTNHMIYLSATIDKPDDETLYYEYKVRQAISDGYLCDYQFIFPIFEQKYTTNQHLAEYLIHRQNETHCLIYASNCKEGKEFVDMLNVIQSGCAGYIDADTTAAKRTKLFADFESGKIRFLINIRVLVEGFNAPHIRSIFFLRVSSSEIFIIQAIGRALRLHPDKIKATIYVPFTHEEDIDRIQAFLTQLSTYDERIKQSIAEKKVGGYLSLEHGEVQEDDEKTDDSVFEFRYNLIVDRMGNSDQLEEMWLVKLKKVKEFIDKNKKRPHNGYKNKKKIITEDTSKQEEMLLSNWLCTQKQNYKKNMYTMNNETIKKLWKDFIDDDNYKKYMINGDERWVYHLEKVKKYIDIENKRPSQESADANIKAMGNWCQQNVFYYQTKKSGNKFKLSRLNLWNEFINDPKYREHFSTEVSWKIKLDMVKKYIDTNNDRPTYYKCKNTDNVDLGKWLDHQISNCNTRIDIVHNNTKIRLLWEQFIEKYKTYFMTQEERWIEKLDHCKKFIKEHKKRPNTKSHNKEERTMAYWITNQIQNYREKCEILGETESLQQLWIPFIADVNKLRGVLTIDDKIEIIRLYDSGITGRCIAEDFGKSPAMISLVIKDHKKYENILNIST